MTSDDVAAQVTRSSWQQRKSDEDEMHRRRARAASRAFSEAFLSRPERWRALIVAITSSSHGTGHARLYQHDVTSQQKSVSSEQVSQ